MKLSKSIIGTLAGLLCLGAAGTAMAGDVKVWTLTFANDSANQAWAKIIADFESANPGIKIKLENRAVDEHKSAMRVSASSDQGPDIYFMWGGYGLGGEFVLSGTSADISKYYDQYKWDDRFLSTSTGFASAYGPGKHGVPYTFHAEALYYNKALFKQAGIESEPKTYDELLAAAEKLKAAGIAPITFGGTVNWHVMRMMDALLETKCGAEKHDALMATKADWSKEACATDSFVELHKWTSNYFLKPFMGIDQGQSFNLFVAGKAAMMLEGDWLVGQLGGTEGAKLDDYGIFAFPTGTNRLYGFAEYNYINSASKNQDEAAKFLDFLASDATQQTHLGQFGSISVNKNIKYDNPKALDAEWMEIMGSMGSMFVNGDQAFSLKNTTEFWRIINEVASDKLDPKAAAGAMQTFIAAN
jgi:raffinose/stachyose/melibiose transport system substrate-binding protein